MQTEHVAVVPVFQHRLIVMSKDIIQKQIDKKYEFGFTTDVDADTLPPGLDEGVIQTISKKKDEPKWLLEWRLKAYRRWLKMKEPKWAHVSYTPINYQAISYFSSPKKSNTTPFTMLPSFCTSLTYAFV